MKLYLNVSSGPFAGKSYEVAGGEVIGREEGDIVLGDPKVSTRHAIVKKTMLGKLVLHDQKSKNGLKVKGKRVDKVTLEPGTSFQIGSNYFSVSKVSNQTKPAREQRQRVSPQPFKATSKDQAKAKGLPKQVTPTSSDKDPFEGLQKIEFSGTGLSSIPAVKALAEEIANSASGATATPEIPSLEDISESSDQSIEQAKSWDPLESVDESVDSMIETSSSSVHDEIRQGLDSIEVQLNSNKETADTSEAVLDQENPEGLSMNTAVLDDLLDEAVVEHQPVEKSLALETDIVESSEDTSSPFSEEVTVASSSIPDEVENTVATESDGLTGAAIDEASLPFGSEDESSSFTLEQELSFKIDSDETEVAKLDAAVDTDLSLPTLESKGTGSSSGISFRTLDEKRQEGSESQNTDHRMRWNNILEDFARENIRKIKSTQVELEPFHHALKMTFFKGIQSETEWVLGYGPRFIGKESLDLPLFDEMAPGEITFSVHPNGDSALLKTDYPEIVQVNGKGQSEIEIKNGDIITFNQTEIEVEILK